MKYIILLGDGMADWPIASLGNKTPLQKANTPYMDLLAQKGCLGMFSTVPEGFHPGSEIANMTVLGYDVSKEFEGRGSLEAASIGVEIKADEMAMRCNLICIEDGNIKNHSAGHISNEEAGELIAFLQQELGDDTFTFHEGISYRHLLIMKHGDKRILCTPPHDVPGTKAQDVMVKPLDKNADETAQKINELILKSQALLENHPINIKRAAQGKDKANSIWPWSPGYKPQMLTLKEKFGIQNGVVISAVDLIKGIGIYAGLTPIEVEGATGLYNTNYEGKAKAAIEALKTNDFVFLHVEASDEAGHEGDIDLKVKTIEYFDDRIVRPIYQWAKDYSEPVCIAILPDHPTPCQIKTHCSDAIPFLIYNPNVEGDKVLTYDEFAAKEGSYGTVQKDEFIQLLFANK